MARSLKVFEWCPIAGSDTRPTHSGNQIVGPIGPVGHLHLWSDWTEGPAWFTAILLLLHSHLK